MPHWRRNAKEEKERVCEYKLAVFTWQKFISALWRGEYQCLRKTHRGKGSWLRVCLRSRGGGRRKTKREKKMKPLIISLSQRSLFAFIFVSSSLHPSPASLNPSVNISFAACLIAAEWWSSATPALINLIMSLFVNVKLARPISLCVRVKHTFERGQVSSKSEKRLRTRKTAGETTKPKTLDTVILHKKMLGNAACYLLMALIWLWNLQTFSFRSCPLLLGSGIRILCNNHECRLLLSMFGFLSVLLPCICQDKDWQRHSLWYK